MRHDPSSHTNHVRIRISNWTHFRDEATDRPHPDLIIPRWNTNGLQPVTDIPLSLHATTLPQELRAAGYRTIHIGNGHFGTSGTPGEDPKAVGFDVRIGGHFSGVPGSYYGTDNFASGGDPASTPWRACDMEKYFGQEIIYLTKALTLGAITAVKEAGAARVEQPEPLRPVSGAEAVADPYCLRKPRRFLELGA